MMPFSPSTRIGFVKPNSSSRVWGSRCLPSSESSAPSTAAQRLWFRDGRWIGAGQLGASPLGREHPVDPGAFGVALMLPSSDLGDEMVTIWDAPIQALAAQHSDLDLDPVEPAGVLGGVVEFDFVEDAVCCGRGEGFVECAA